MSARRSSRRTRQQRPSHLAVAKDVLTFGLGMALIVRQGWFVDPSQINIWTMIFGGALIQVPAASQLLAGRIGSLPTLPPEQESSPSPSSSPVQ